MILESWFTALGYLHRCSPLRLKARWMIFLAALVPWLFGLGVAVMLMLSLFWISDFTSADRYPLPQQRGRAPLAQGTAMSASASLNPSSTPRSTSSGSTSLLDPEFLHKLEQLELVSRKIFVGRMKGERKSLKARLVGRVRRTSQLRVRR